MLTQDEGMVHTSYRIIPCYVYTGDRNNWQPAIVEDEYDYNEIMEMMATPVKSTDYYSYYDSGSDETEETQAFETEAPVYTDAPAQEETVSEVLTE